MGKGKIKAMATKFPEKFAIITLTKYRKFCRRCLTHLDAIPIFQIHMRHPVQFSAYLVLKIKYLVCTLGVSPSLVSRYYEGYSFL